MQLIGPLFLFMFLPLCWLFLLPLPARMRPYSLSILCLVWYVAVNRQNLFGLLPLRLYFAFAFCLSAVGNIGVFAVCLASWRPLAHFSCCESLHNFFTSRITPWA